MRIRGYVVRRFLEMIPVVLIIITLNFVILHLAPSDPAEILAGERGTPEYIKAMRKEWGLDKPLYEQLVLYVVNVFRGELGYSLAHQRPVLTMILERIPNTLLLVLPSQLLSITLGILIGALCAKRYESKMDRLLSTLSIVVYSMPVFWFGLVLILLFAIALPLFPLWGLTTLGSESSGMAYFVDVLWHLVLPVVALSGSYLPPFISLTRSGIVEVVKEDFITTARAKGLDENRVFFKHALRNALLPSVTQAGLLLGLALSGAMMVEIVFGWPGLGELMYKAVFNRDYPLLMGMFLVTSIGVVAASLITDIMYALLDPRVVYK